MPYPVPPNDGHSQRSRAIQRLRSAVDAAIREGQNACRDPRHVALAQPLLERLEQIGCELNRMDGLQSGLANQETHPFWLDLMRNALTQNPWGRSPPPENISR